MKLLFALLLVIPAFSQTIPTAFRSVVAARTPQWNDNVAKARRARAVEVDASLFDEAAARAARTITAAAKTIDFNLFDGTTWRVDLGRPEFAGRNNQTIIWTGKIQNTQRGQLVMAVTGKIHSATLTNDSGATYLLRQADSLVHWVMEGDSSQLPPDGPPKRVRDGELGPAPRAPAVPDDGTTVDVLVVYTAAARNAAGGVPQMINQIALGVAETNQGYANSGIIQRVRLTDAVEVTYTEASDMSVDLDRLTSPTDGFLDEVHALRESSHADLVSLWRTAGNYCGIAWLLTDLTSNFASRAFSVVATNCATGYYTFAHEMGHNMGANHDVANSGGGGAFPYSYGYQQKTQAPFFRTVMAYACSGGVTCDRINYWSNPLNTYSGIATGTATADNTSTLNNTRSIASNWRQAGNGNTLSPTSANYSSQANTGSVTVTATDIWTAVSSAAWLTISSGSTGTGNGTVTYQVDTNTTPALRTATLTIAGQIFTVIQAGASIPCVVAPLTIPQTVSGTLTTSDCLSQLRPNSYAKRFTFNAAAGQQLSITQTSSTFDTFLFLLSPSGTVLTQDDDSGGGTNSRIPASGFYTIPLTGIYTVEATSYTTFTTGAFNLTLAAPTGCNYTLSSSSASFSSNPGTGSITVTTATGCTWNASSSANWISITSSGTTTGSGTATYSFTGNSGASSRIGTILVAGLTFTVTQGGLSSGCSSTPISIGATVNSSLTSTCTSLNRGANYYAARYSFDAVTGQQVAIALNSTAFDTYLYLVGPNGTVVALDDDSGGSLNSRIPTTGFFSLPQTGTYTIEATTFSQARTGAFTLALTGGCTFSVSPLSSTFSSAQSNGTLTLTTQTGCAWTAISNDTWLIITSTASSTGSGTINFTAAANVTGVPRIGTLTVAGNTVTVGQSFTSTNCPTTAITAGQTASGSIATQCYSTGRGSGYYANRYTFNGTAGQQISIDLNSSAFDPYLYLISPTGGVVASDDDGGPGSNSRIPAESGTFTLPAAGAYTIEVTTFSRGATGAFTLTLTAPGPAGISISPSSGSGSPQVFALQINNPAGAADVVRAQLQFTSGGAANACLIYYDRASSNLALLNDAGTVFGTGVPIGSSTLLQNNQCIVNPALSSVVASGATITVNIHITFKTGFTGNKTISAEMYTSSSFSSGYSTIGSWNPTFTVVPPITITPSSGSGSSQRFNISLYSSTGIPNIIRAQILFGTSGAANACLVYYDRASNQLSLLNDAGLAFSSGATIGGATVLQNAQCLIDASQATAGGSGLTQTLSLNVVFKPAFVGVKTISGELYTSSSGSTGYSSVGTWTVTAPAPGQPATVTPSAGAGITQTFAFQITSPASLGSPLRAQVLFNTTANGANSCLVYYDRFPNQLLLLNDAGNTFIGPFSLGSAETLQNSQCIISLASSSASFNGTTLNLNLNVTFKPAFIGTKAIFAEYFAGTVSSGYQNIGSWTVPGSGMTVTPSSGSGASQIFTYTLTSIAGVSNIVRGQLLFSATSGGASSCLVYFDRAANQFLLLNDAGSAFLGPITIGSSATLQNSQCILNGATSSVSATGVTQTVNIGLTFKAAFNGIKTIFSEMYQNGPGSTGYQVIGTYNVAGASAQPLSF